MAHKVSAAALEAAGTLLRSYSIEVREGVASGRLDGLRADERCAAILIDYATNAFEVAQLRPELRYWQERLHARTATAPQLLGFLQRMIDAFAKVPQEKSGAKITATMETPPAFGMRPVICELSRPSMEAARFLFHYYDVAPKKRSADLQTDRVRVASLVESSMGLSRAMRAAPLAADARASLAAGRLSEQEVRERFRELGILLEYLPNFEDRREEVKLI